MKGTSVNDSMMTNRYIVAYSGSAFLIGAMNAGTILDIHPVTDPDKINVSPDHRIELDAAVIPGCYLSHYSGIGSKEIIFAEDWLFSFYRKYECHAVLFK